MLVKELIVESRFLEGARVRLPTDMHNLMSCFSFVVDSAVFIWEGVLCGASNESKTF